MAYRTTRPSYADFNVVSVEGLFPVISQNGNVSTSITIEAFLALSSKSISENAGAILIQPAGAMYVNFGAPATTANFLMVANTQYKVSGYKRVLDTINLYATGSTKVNVIVYGLDDVEGIWGSSSSQSSSSSTNSSSTSSASPSSRSSVSLSSVSSMSLSSQSTGSSSTVAKTSSSSNSKSSASSASLSSASSNSSSSSSKSSASSASSVSSESSSSVILSRSSASNSSLSSNH